MHIAVESISVESMQCKLFVVGGLTHVTSLLHEIIKKQIATLKNSNLIILNMILNKKNDFIYFQQKTLNEAIYNRIVNPPQIYRISRPVSPLCS